MGQDKRRISPMLAALGLIGCCGWWLSQAPAKPGDRIASWGLDRLGEIALALNDEPAARAGARAADDATNEGDPETSNERAATRGDGAGADRGGGVADVESPETDEARGALGDTPAGAPGRDGAGERQDSAADEAKEEESRRGVVIMGGLARAMDSARRPSVGGGGGDNERDEEPRCGDGVVDEDEGEECDDGNDDKYDGCESSCLRTGALQVAGGYQHTCALLTSGEMKCWGENFRGQLGLGDTQDIGDSRTPDEFPPVEVGGPVRSIAVASDTTCALLENGDVRCWGAGDEGQLGYGDTEDVGDDELPADKGSVELGGPAKQICAQGRATCAVMKDGAVRCWGTNHGGRNGLGLDQVIGDDEVPSSVSPVDVGGPVQKLYCGGAHVCALLESRELVCWGDSEYGRHGHPGRDDIGDDETPASVGVVDVGGAPVDVSGGGSNTCVTFEGGHMRCFGGSSEGQLGYGSMDHYGDDEPPSAAPILDTGGRAIVMMTGGGHNCLVLEGGVIRCYGKNDAGQLGLGNTVDQVAKPADVTDIKLGATVRQADAGNYHTCVVTEQRGVRCWGRGSLGRLGYGNTRDVGDTLENLPQSVGDVPLL